MKKSFWTPEQDEIMFSHYANTSMPKLMAMLPKTESAIYQRARTLGLRKNEDYLNSAEACRLRRGDNVGLPFRFVKGQAAWNKGTNFVAGGRSIETRFKSGGKPLNTLPIGSYRLDKHNVLQRKISDKPGNASGRWRSVHELVWTEVNGPLPPKHIVVFKKGMKTNVLEEITIEKVECISLAENMKRNSLHRYPKEIAQLIQLQGAINRQINKKEKKHEQSTNP